MIEKERINRLKEAVKDAVPYIESRRAILVTEAYKESEGLSPILRRAKAVEKIFNNIPIVIREDELIVGAINKNPKSIEIFPEFSYKWRESDFEIMVNRKTNPVHILEKVQEELREVFKYWKGKATSELADSYMSQITKDCIDNGVFTLGNYFYSRGSHIRVDYSKVLEKGFRGIIIEVINAIRNMDVSDPEYIKKQQFYEAIVITYNAAIKFSHRYADKAREMAEVEYRKTRKEELLKIAEICDRVPEYGASNFYEACQLFWFVQIFLQIESNNKLSLIGCFEQYMNPYYKDDKDITKEFMQELIECVRIKVNDIKKDEEENDAGFFNLIKVIEITLNNGRIGNKQLGPITGDITTFKSMDDFFKAFEKQMSFFIHHFVEAYNCVEFAYAERAPFPFLSALVDDCIKRGKSVQEGGAVYNLTVPQVLGIDDSGYLVYAIQKHIFEDKDISKEELKEALRAKFGHDIAAQESSASMNAEILKTEGDIEVSRSILYSTLSIDNNIDKVKMIAEKCAQIYSCEVEKYTNPRGGRFKADIFTA